jgi:hypothetical protein
MPQQGYMIVALGGMRYLEMAISCAASIKCFDKHRPIQLLTDIDCDGKDVERVFDYVDVIEVDPTLIGPLFKLKAYQHKRFEKTMFVDCDCLMFETVDRYWDLLADYKVACLGSKKTKGEWYGMEIAEICKDFAIEYVVKTNSGMLYFDNDEVTDRLFQTAWSIWLKRGNFTGHDHRGAGAPDEPYIGVAYGIEKMAPMPWVIDNMGHGLMQSTIAAKAPVFNLDGQGAYFEKHGMTIRPAIVHFVGSKPKDIYRDLMNAFRERMDIPSLEGFD